MSLESIREALRRIGKSISRTPWPLAIAVGMLIFFAPHEDWHGDLINFRNHPEALRHPYWTKWLFSLLAKPPEIVAYISLSIVSIVAFYFAARVFDGRKWVVFLSFPFAWTLYYGQIDSIAVAGLAIAYWALRSDRPIIMGLGFVLASVKPQLSLPLALAMFWWSSSRLRSLLFPVLVLAASLLFWGFWVPEWLVQVFDIEYLTGLSRNMSLWTYIGPIVLIVWIPVLFTDLCRSRKLMLIGAATAMSMPYFPLPSLVLLLVLPVPAWVWFVSWLPGVGMGFTIDVYAVVSIVIAPALYIWVLWPNLQPWIRRSVVRSRGCGTPPENSA